MTSFRLTILLLGTLVAVSGCGRKNLPVAPAGSARSAEAPRSPDDNAPASVKNFKRANSITGGTNLTTAPSEVSRNPRAARKTFPLDFLLN